MGDMRDQLKKAKLLSKKRAGQLAHEDRVHLKKVGREGVEQEEGKRKAELQRQQEVDRARDRERQEALEADRQMTAERAACTDILRNDVVKPKGRGQRWYFQLEGGALPWLEVDENMGFHLQSGAYWVVRVGPAGSHTYGLLGPDLAKRVAAALPERVAWAPGQA